MTRRDPGEFCSHYRAHENRGPRYRDAFYPRNGSGPFEIRAKGREGIGRAFFCMLVSHRIVILHGFIKKTEQTPPREIEIARSRMREVKHG